MRTRPFGATGVEVAVLGQGTWRVADTRTAPAAIEEGLRLGMSHIDTAELYEQQSGSETMLGGLLAGAGPDGRPLREQVFLASKVLPAGATRKGTKGHCKDSLVRLGTDRLDLYYLHWVGPHPIAESMAALAELADIGWIRHVGVSNFDVEELDEAKSALGRHRLAANQVLYHLEERGMEAEVLPWCRRNGVAVVGYSPFGAGRFVVDPRRKAVLEQVAREAGRTPRQVALAFLARDPAVFLIPKAERVEHVRENAGGDFDLPADAVERIDAAFRVQPQLSRF